jgi:demethylmenaquinone methyltransferase/2-methoxy-6-polyprenyl-1,4-benzoquinol methylase
MQTHFGYKSVDVAQKEPLVKGVFSSVASNYDLMNDVMSFGIHRAWKCQMLDLLTDPSKDLLDVAGGTADIALRYWQKTTIYKPKIIACDINHDMLKAGRDKLINQNILAGIEFACGNAQSLPFSDMSFGYYTIAFGIRNVTHIDQALAEAYRVLKPGGKFVCLEFSSPTNQLVGKIYDLYSFNLIPLFGKLIANDRDSYQYLVESIRNFPKQADFAEMIKKAGFAQVGYKNLSNGIVAIHYGYRI